jgi:hypothetical protein
MNLRAVLREEAPLTEIQPKTIDPCGFQDRHDGRAPTIPDQFHLMRSLSRGGLLCRC